jgi:2-polyprenyl-3-methyl-5-hydroxy-6-metoxy-1,4-benzoquinol methylase
MTETTNDVAGKAFWQATWSGLPPIETHAGPVFEQHPVLQPFLEQLRGGTAIEIGCVPGNWLLYLAKEFGLRVAGIDYSGRLDYVRKNLEHNDIAPLELIEADFFSYEPSRNYDLVFSSGFVEHFEDYDGVVARHVRYARPGGMIVIMVPNLRWLHWGLSRLFAPETLKVHRLHLMRRSVLISSLERAGASVLHCGYQTTFRPVYALPGPVDFLSRALQKILRLLRLNNIGNPFGSPSLIAVALRRPEEH